MRWVWWHQPSGPNEYRIRELLRGIWDFHAISGISGTEGPWLWRGQASFKFDLEAAGHTRMRCADADLRDDAVVSCVESLLHAARAAAVDRHEGVKLPDMSLLAMLQHHGAATPLLDVTLDPLVALYMAVVSATGTEDAIDGALFAFQKPTRELAPFDSRRFREIYQTLGSHLWLYSAPDVSERLRIQRGHFVVGRLNPHDHRTTLPVTIERGDQKNSWLWKRLKARGTKGPVPIAQTTVAVFRVTASFKERLRTWLEARSGLTKDFVFPTAWHQPHLDQFARSHSRISVM